MGFSLGSKKQAPERGSVDEAEERLLKARVVALFDAIDDEVATMVMAKLLFLQDQDPTLEMTLLINSLGGSVTASLAIYETMREMKSPISTMCTDEAAGTGLLLLSAGTQGKRVALDTAVLSFVPMSGGANGGASEIERLEHALALRFARATGQSPSRIRRAFRDGEVLSPPEAVTFGLIDAVARRR